MLRTLVIVALLWCAINVTAHAGEADVTPTRFLVIRAWHGDTLTMLSQVPLVPGHPATYLCGDGGLQVPEGMAPPPIKVSSLISVRIFGVADKERYASLDQTDAALAHGNHFVVGDVEIRILDKEADRFIAVLFDSQVPGEKAVALPDEVAFDEDDKDFLPNAAITGWISGSLFPMTEPVLIDQTPRKPSITLHDNEEGK